MVDNTNVPNLPTGISVASDDVGGVQYQRIKLDKGGNGVSSPIIDGNPLPVVNEAGSANIGSVDVPTAAPTVYNVTLTNANTEYSQALPANTRGFEFQAQSEALVRFAFVTGKVATPTAPWLTLKAGDAYSSPQINQAASPSTLYLASPTAGTIVEILAWT